MLENGGPISERLSALESGFRLLPHRVSKLEEDTLGLVDKLDSVIGDVKPLPARLLNVNEAVSRLENDMKSKFDEIKVNVTRQNFYFSSEISETKQA